MGSDQKTDRRYRSLGPVSRNISRVLLMAMPVFCILYMLDISTYLDMELYKEQYLALFLTLFLSSTFLNVPPSKQSPRDRLPWYDIILSLLPFFIFGNVVIFFPELFVTIGFATTGRAVMGLIAILLTFEAARRIAGYPLVIIGGILVLYARFAYLMPGLLNARGVSWKRLFVNLYLDPNSLLGIPTGVAGTMVVGFLFFGVCLFVVGGGEFLSNIALALLGKQRGGAAKAGVIASGLFGSLSGSASANVAVTGVVTIPLMKRTGYLPHFAGAVEATASTGGLVLPPVMAITAFMMAEFLGMPYYKIAISAAIPAILYYVAVLTQVHLEAVKMGIEGLPEEEIPSFKQVFKDGWIYLIPIAGLLYFLFYKHLNPTSSAIYSGVMFLIVGMVKKENRRNVGQKIVRVFEDTGRQVLIVAAACSLAGLVIGSVSLTNLGLSLSKTLIAVSGGNIFFLLFLGALGAIVLGMGMPIAPTYIMLVILIAPALVEMGVLPLAAHLFINFFGAMSFVTPPVCVAAFVAAGIAESTPMKVGFTAARLGIGAYVVPFTFCYSNGLLLKGSFLDIVGAVVPTTLGIIFIAVGLSGYLFRKLNFMKRVVFIVGGLLMMTPRPLWEGIGLAICLVLAGLEFLEKRSGEKGVTAEPKVEMATE
ncbi:MAG: TRAP transporter fused permease subunit [Deltaproteobacteria bacterium]|nr:TRAP transporter fused permease subunit [Deltaproteobacteria bacterium]